MEVKIKATVAQDASSQDIFQSLMISRGHKTKSEQKEFLHPPDLTLEYLLVESGLTKTILGKAKKILDSHLSKNNDICIFGDYDADGVTATAVMWQAITAYAKLKGSKSKILPFLPDRHRHGYGISDPALDELLARPDFHPQLVITVDTGIVAHSGVERFRKAGIDVIITDHHVPEPTLPTATAIIHTLTTSGAGVAWIFAMYLLDESAMKLLDLATIGVVGDMMPLTGLNRAICAHGLKSLTRTKRPGLLSMKANMGIGERPVTTYDISFGMAPRINAAGRIYNPLDALRLLCTNDPKLAQELALKIESHNRDRQEYTDQALKLASSLEVKHKVIVVQGEYHEGVIGLVAGKLSEIFHRPALVISTGGEIVKGSARSVPGVNITSLLRSLKTPFLGLGGHDQAAGFSLAQDQVHKMSREIERLGDQKIDDKLLVKSHIVDLALPLGSTSLVLSQLIATLEPFGMGNPKPKFLFENLTVLEDRQLGEGGKHRKLMVEQGSVTRELMLFNSKEIYPLKHLKSVIATLDINVWKDKTSLQLIGSYVET